MISWIISVGLFCISGVHFVDESKFLTLSFNGSESVYMTTMVARAVKLDSTMDKSKKLLVLKEDQSSLNRGLDFRVKRNRVKKAILDSGAKMRHDSGGRFIIVEVSEKSEKQLLKRLPNAKLIALDSELKDLLVSDMDSNERRFIEALQIRTSKKFREVKKNRKPGESEEEKELFSASCVRDEY